MGKTAEYVVKIPRGTICKVEGHPVKLKESLYMKMPDDFLKVHEAMDVDDEGNIDIDTISDGFGSTWSKTCPECGRKTMVVIRPGKAQCMECG